MTTQPQSNRQNRPTSDTSDKFKQHGGIHKWDFVNNKHNIGKNWCDNFWWFIISCIIFGMGAYVRLSFKL